MDVWLNNSFKYCVPLTLQIIASFLNNFPEFLRVFFIHTFTKLKEIKKETVKSDHELELEKYQEMRKLEREEEAKKLREEQNKVKFVSVEPIRKDPNRGMRFISCSEPIN